MRKDESSQSGKTESWSTAALGCVSGEAGVIHSTATAHAHGRRISASLWIVLGLILLGSFSLKLRDLGHPSLTYFDESFHAVVARNLLKHPLTPTLIDTPYLPVGAHGWEDAHIWLHKGIVPLWQIAASFAVFGVDVFALRLPSLLLGTFSILLTFEIGRRLIDARAAMIAATLQGASVCFAHLARGKWFSDHVDTALLFYLELGFLFLVVGMQSGLRRWFILAGVAQGLAYLSKSFVGLLIAGVVLTLLTLVSLGFGRQGKLRLQGRQVLWMFAATLVTVAPWTLWCMMKFPTEFWYELVHVGRHLNTDVEGWAAPWDRLHFDYSILLYTTFYAPVLTAWLALLPRCWVRRDIGLALLQAWSLLVLVVFTFATAKTVTATIIAMPAMFLLFGALVSFAWQGDAVALAAWAVITLIGVIEPVGPRTAVMGAPDSAQFGAIASKELWVFRHLAVGVGAALLAFCVRRGRGARSIEAKPRHDILSRAGRNGAQPPSAVVHLGGRIVAALATIVLLVPMIRDSWRAGTREAIEPTYNDIGRYVQTTLPPNAVLLVDRAFDGEHRFLQFFGDRTCYGASDDWRQVAQEIRKAGGLPFFLSYRSWSLPVIFSSHTDHRTLYECPPDDSSVIASPAASTR